MLIHTGGSIRTAYSSFQIGMCFSLHCIIQFLQYGTGILSFQCPGQQQIRNRRVFGQKAAMSIGAKDIFVPGSFQTIPSVVSVSANYLTHGTDAAAKPGSSSVIFKGHNICTREVVTFKQIISDEAFPAFHAVHIQRTKEIKLLAVGFLIVTAQ